MDFSLLVYNAMPWRSTLSDANLRLNECLFEAIYGELYATYKRVLSADSRRCGCPKWIERLQIIDSTTISLFSNLIFKGVGGIRRPGKRRAASKFTPIFMPTSLCPPTFVSPLRPRGIPSCSAPPTTPAAEYQCHQNSDFGHIDRQFTAHGAAKADQTQLEFP